MTVARNLRVLTFNVWNTPVAHNNKDRFAGIANALKTNADDLDVVALLECWIESDRNSLIAAGHAGGLVHSVFFRNGAGFPGGQASGLVVLSKWPIENSFYHRFSAAGKPQKLAHWDFTVRLKSERIST